MWSEFQYHLPGDFWVPVSPVSPDYTPDFLVRPRREILEKTRVPGKHPPLRKSAPSPTLTSPLSCQF